MHTATFRAVGGSVSVTLPHQMLRIPGLAASASVAVTVEAGRLVLSPALQPERGHEQQGTRSALVLLPEAFNRFGLGLACPVTRAGAPGRWPWPAPGWRPVPWCCATKCARWT